MHGANVQYGEEVTNRKGRKGHEGRRKREVRRVYGYHFSFHKEMVLEIPNTPVKDTQTIKMKNISLFKPSN